ncbi:hypothetical protein GCWU000324_01500 [Kingella oralis ATCC 51147]|uniref:Uncharacterized protein n=1 Tax=Kingella oralis ATCC 51147 TaxID=629741 RepID=C4GKJ7_9NEIS|nr:hypothetical protein GCWU000324_01500 [Kingella oralis ATCC 51147]
MIAKVNFTFFLTCIKLQKQRILEYFCYFVAVLANIKKHGIIPNFF